MLRKFKNTLRSSFLKAMFKDALQEMLEAELDVELSYEKEDINGEFEPTVISKNIRNISKIED
ncbi:hypothetical protein SAMN02194393_03055 [Maledivibacter halophilus]|uniref:Transposase, Mutator family n=1 Tax=Maledivibacter halophilus TaxID=36842 RepID=A0A1T5LLX3_9FIRM|nr:hypothetical protein SAMN02194393_03055 [Maledivibacter halophilus]